MFRSIAIVALLMLAGVAVSAQDMRPAEQVYKNIKVMTGVPANQILEGMHVIKAALGVTCEHCHIQGQMDRDDLAAKNKARAMYLMMSELNRANFGGRQLVTCYTCHRGHATPANVPDLPSPSITEETESKPTLPTVDQILAKYITALGGEQAMRKVTTRVITATQEVATGPGGTIPLPAKLVRSLKAPNLVLDVYVTDKFTISDGFDGTARWTKGQNGAVNVLMPGGVDGERAERAAVFYEPLTLKGQYASMKVDGIEHVNGHDAYVVTGVPAADTPEKLYFDTQSGLLLRKSTYLDAMSGRSPYQVDFDEYRNTGSGVKIPFVVRMLPAGPRLELSTRATLRITGVKDNVPLDEVKFVKPTPTPQPPRP
jgi:hypothetical protein